MYESGVLAMLFSPCLLAAPVELVVPAEGAVKKQRRGGFPQALLLPQSRSTRWTGYPAPARVRRDLRER
jgi:hypothetical protein